MSNRILINKPTTLIVLGHSIRPFVKSVTLFSILATISQKFLALSLNSENFEISELNILLKPSVSSN